MRAEIRPTKRLSLVSARLLSSNSSTDCSSRQKARITRTPVRFSRVSAVTRSSPAWTLPKSGMLMSMMPKTTAKRTGMVTAKTRALRKSMVKAITMAPRTMKGLRSRSRRPRFRPFCTWLTSSESRVMRVSLPRRSSSA